MDTVANVGWSGKTILLWVLRILSAGIFLAAAFMKLSGQQQMVDEFAIIGLGQGFRYLTGILELAGGIALLIPRFSPLGALLLLAVDAGAFVAQVAALHQDWIHTIVIGALLVAVVALQRPALKALIGR
ncbi:putative membrane protein YphA (DoxX/SURF4 family) [Rhizobium aquaticum]|uniref:Membrane protein YphA (DoxX/SURF4 family) n=1 Tax=Rhizobium aquaticum TaxID=1549636 RepID=A0ABV2J5B6_9HYPH